MEILVSAALGAYRGRLEFGSISVPCALGRSGIAGGKREGDGGTPMGRFALRRLLYRADRLALPPGGLPATPISPHDGWCDAPGDPAYNRPVRLPYPASCETLWREDHLYDLVVTLGYNDAPVRPGAGSAIFFHLAKEEADGGLAATEGCVALTLENMLRVLARCTSETHMTIRMR